MKSALANIGETELSSFARKLEEAGREQNAAVITAETPMFIKILRTLHKKIQPGKDTITGAVEDITDNNRTYLHEKLLAIQAASSKYDKKTAKDTLADLRQKKWPGPIKELLHTISEYLLHSEFEDAANLVGDYVKKQKL